MFQPLTLKDVAPLIEGSRRYVFQHPRAPGLLVKVLKSEAGKAIPLGVPGLHIRRPNEMVRTFRREIGEFLRVRAKLDAGPLPIARVFGVVDTDIGNGLLVERIAGRDGRLAPSLKGRVHERGFDDDLRRLLLALRDELIDLGVVVGVGAGGADRLVIVDGIGDKTFVPVNTLSPYVNRMSLRRRFDRMTARLQELDRRR